MISEDRNRDNKASSGLFLDALGLHRGARVCLVGAGGKTSLMYRLAQEARSRGDKVLVTTSTKLQIPLQHQYDAIDLSGNLFADSPILGSQIFVAGRPAPIEGKMVGCVPTLLNRKKEMFDLILIEADGAARKCLKGWNNTEPVIPDFTTHTIGIIDISSIGKRIDEDLVHRLEIFIGLTGCQRGDTVNLQHLHKIITHEAGLFGKARGKKTLYINKVESGQDIANYQSLQRLLPNVKLIAGSIYKGTIYN